MTASQIIFYIIAGFILITAFLSVTTRKIFRAAIWLLFSLMGIAAFYFWLKVEFIAAVQIVVYVGGIVVLIIFSIFLTQQSGSEMPRPPRARVISSLLAVLFGLGFTGTIIYRFGFEAVDKPFNWTMSSIGTKMLETNEDGFALPFEVVSILLLAAMIGCIVIAMRTAPKEDPEVKKEKPSLKSEIQPE